MIILFLNRKMNIFLMRLITIKGVEKCLKIFLKSY